MLTTLIIVLMAVALFAYVALPLINPAGADPLPSEKDPLLVDLEEEKEALFRAIRELDARDDLSVARRDQLRARYEAKAAKVLRALDERTLAGGRAPAPTPRRRSPPYGALALLATVAVIAVTLSAFVLPRVGNGTVTTFFSEDLQAAGRLRELRRAADRDPSAENLLALADAYWMLEDAENARETYRRAVDEAGAQSALAFQRLGYLVLEEDPEETLALFEQALELDPTHLDTLFAVGELNFAFGRLDEAETAWRAFLAQGEGGDSGLVRSRLELVTELRPVAERVAAEPTEENLLAYADVLWRHDEHSRALDAYFAVLTQHDAADPVALGRAGQVMFLNGRNDDAIVLMERAASTTGVDPQTLLFLGNAYFSAERYQEAIAAWERHVALVGEDAAGRVPSLIDDARRRLAGESTDPVAFTSAENGGEGAGSTPAAAAAGASIFAANCSSCHGASGQGGAGPRLAGNPRATDEANVRDAVSFGRGAMPAFRALLTPDELDAVVAYVTGELAPVGPQ